MLEYKDAKKDKLTADFANCVDPKPLAGVLLLGNLFYLKERVTISQVPAINDCIDAIAANVTPSQLNNMLKTALTVDKTHKDLMEKDSIAALDTFVTYSIEDKALRGKVNNDNLVLCASQLQHTLRASVSLIQNHLISQKEGNPFASFDYGLLKNASHDQIKQYLSAIVKGCKSLPEADLIQIGEKSEAAARIICSIIYSHDKRCEIEAKFADKHPNMRPKVAKQWTKTASSVPQTTTKESNMKRKAADLGRKHPEFTLLSNLMSKKDMNQPDADDRKMARNLLLGGALITIPYWSVGTMMGIGAMVPVGLAASSLMGISASVLTFINREGSRVGELEIKSASATRRTAKL